MNALFACTDKNSPMNNKVRYGKIGKLAAFIGLRQIDGNINVARFKFLQNLMKGQYANAEI